MLDANILGLLRPFLEIEGVPGIAHHPADSGMIYDPPELEFLTLVRDHGLQNYLPILPEKSLDYVVYRRSVICRAFDVFLHRDDQHQFPEILNFQWDEIPSGIEGSDYASFWTDVSIIQRKVE